ncbi:hypothetical protein RUM43_003748 [Polyplax serrata]|uniref:Uncharacterized protein n=1 Tax=Polyplax serrata TaxID=468196 RepID=A0AAN8PG01_POLSC
MNDKVVYLKEKEAEMSTKKQERWNEERRDGETTVSLNHMQRDDWEGRRSGNRGNKGNGHYDKNGVVAAAAAGVVSDACVLASFFPELCLIGFINEGSGNYASTAGALTDSKPPH